MKPHEPTQFAASAPSEAGLSESEAARRLAQHGPNELPVAKRRDMLRIALEVVREPMLLLLIAGERFTWPSATCTKR